MGFIPERLMMMMITGTLLRDADAKADEMDDSIRDPGIRDPLDPTAKLQKGSWRPALLLRQRASAHSPAHPFRCCSTELVGVGLELGA